jgi:hypothetical protein
VSRAGVVALVLSAWLGAGVLFAAVVAPAAFAVLPSRTLAGALVGRVLPIIFIVGIVVALASLGLDRADAGRLPRVRRVALVVAAASCAIAQFAVGPRIKRVRREISGPIEQLPAGDPRRAAFGRLHAASVAWLGLAMIAAAATVVLVSVPPRSRTHGAAEPLVPAHR